MTRLRMLLGLLVVAGISVTSLSADDKKPADPKKDPTAAAPDEKKPDTVKPDDKKDPPPPTPRGTLPPNWKKLGLTDEQVKKVYKVEAEYRAKIDELEQKVKDLKLEERQEMEKILTDAQKARLKEIKDGPSPDKDKPSDPVKPPTTVPDKKP